MTSRRSKIALVCIVGLLVVSFIVPYRMAKRLTQELWAYRDANTDNNYMLLAKLSDKKGGIYGATSTLEPSSVQGTSIPFARSKQCVLFVKKVDAFTSPDDKLYQWVQANELMRAVKFALTKRSFRDVVVESHYGATVVLDDRLLEALAQGDHENMHKI